MGRRAYALVAAAIVAAAGGALVMHATYVPRQWQSAFDEAVEGLEESLDSVVEAEREGIQHENLPIRFYRDPAAVAAATGGGQDEGQLQGGRGEGGAQLRVAAAERAQSRGEVEGQQKQQLSSAPAHVVVEAEAAPHPDGVCSVQANAEMWGDVVRLGTELILDTPDACCKACHDHKAKGCNVWVYCGDQAACGGQYKQCWLKKQQDARCPEVRARGTSIPWTSGTVVVPGRMYKQAGQGGILGMPLEPIITFVMNAGAHGPIALRIRLRPDWEPHVSKYIWESGRECEPGWCDKQTFIYRAEPAIDEGGAPVPGGGFLQGMFEVAGIGYPELPEKVGCQTIKSGHLTWLADGHFEVHLKDHDFQGAVFAEIVGMDGWSNVAKILQLPAKTQLWGGGVKARVLEEKLFFDPKKPGRLGGEGADERPAGGARRRR